MKISENFEKKQIKSFSLNFDTGGKANERRMRRTCAKIKRKTKEMKGMTGHERK